MDKEETMKTKNIFDVNLSRDVTYHNEEESRAIDEFYFGKSNKYQKKEKKQKENKKRKGKGSDTYDQFLKQSISNNATRMTMDRLGDNNQPLPYICYP